MQCELCNMKHDGKYGSGRFCSIKCARHFAGRSGGLKAQEKRTYGIRKYISNLSEDERKARAIKSRSGLLAAFKLRGIENPSFREVSDNVVIKEKSKLIELNITKKELIRYKEKHNRCEICGIEDGIYTKTFAIDHQHNTNNFRGLLCLSCNTKLGWYENRRVIIEDYLERNILNNTADI